MSDNVIIAIAVILVIPVTLLLKRALDNHDHRISEIQSKDEEDDDLP
jgi:hypothetical protein